MNFCVHLNLGKIIIFIEIKIHHKYSNMVVHSCCCILFLYCVVWNRISNWMEFAFKICLEIGLENRKENSLPPLAFGPKVIFLSLVPRRRPVSSLRADPVVSFLLPARAEAAPAAPPRPSRTRRPSQTRRRTSSPCSADSASLPIRSSSSSVSCLAWTPVSSV